ncbi:MAG: NAD(P)-dependent oxidoreductase [Nitrospirae bacterium]|nr:MAG: NAD(P)-dependent oxidoreductase [Nitrospirota bacterium]
MIGFVGLGNLGRAIANRLISKGHRLLVWNRTRQKAEGLDARIASSLKEVVSEAEVVFLCLFDSRAVKAVLTAKEGLLSEDVKDKVIIDLSTNHFRDVLNFYRLCEERGAHYLESPVLGSVVPASQGALTVLTGGERKAYERVKPLLQDIGRHLFYFEKPTVATKMKLINNLTLGSFMATLAEAIALAEDAGIDRSEAIEILSVGGGNSLVLNAKREKLLKEDFSTHFSNALIYKDLHCLQDLAFEMKRPLFTASVVKELFGETCKEGFSDEDFSSIYKLFKRKG